VRTLQSDLSQSVFRLDFDDQIAFVNHYPDPRLFSTASVFAEWSLRSRLKNEHALPVVIRDSIINPLLDPNSGISLDERYKRFVKILRSQPFYAEYLTSDIESSLCHR